MRWLGAAVCVPLMATDQLIGVIILGPKKNKFVYNNEDKKFLSHVAGMVSVTIKNHIVGETFPVSGLAIKPQPL
jgi:GAF domain-containing protein